MCQWFDIWSVRGPELHKELQVEGLRDSVSAIVDVIRYEMALVAPERIFSAASVKAVLQRYMLYFTAVCDLVE